MKPFIKICGLMRPEDARLAVTLGATHIGVVRSPDSPRSTSPERARRVFAAGEAKARTVLVCRGVPIEQVVLDAKAARAETVQLYDASEEDVERIADEGFQVFRVYRMDENETSLPELLPAPSERRPALLDVGGGGTGRRFDWSLLGSTSPDATFIAGGIRPDNVRELLDRRPYGIDLASGVENAPGVKDPAKLEALFAEVLR